MSGYKKISELLNGSFVSVFSEEEGGDLLKSGFSFPGTPEEELGTDTVSQITATAGAAVGAGGCSGAQPAPSHTAHSRHGTHAQKPLTRRGTHAQKPLTPCPKNLSLQSCWEFLTCCVRLENQKQKNIRFG